jgi:hypothetical protein
MTNTNLDETDTECELTTSRQIAFRRMSMERCFSCYRANSVEVSYEEADESPR